MGLFYDFARVGAHSNCFKGSSTVKKFAFLFVVVLLMGVPAAYAQDPALVDDAINAFNNNDTAYFEKHLAAEVVWLDEDGHAIAGKERVVGFITRRLMVEGQKIVTRNVKVFTSGDAAWSHFNYAIEVGGNTAIEGLGSAVFRKVGDDWQIVLIHGAHNVLGTHN